MGDDNSLEDWDWDDAFVEELIQVEEQALLSSSTNPTQRHHPHHHPPSPPLPPAPCISYSPPRQLSQIFKNDIVHKDKELKEQEIDRLKRELGRVSEKLTHKEKECSELRRERDKKEKQLRSVFSGNESKDANAHCPRKPNSRASLFLQSQSKRIALSVAICVAREYEVPIQDHSIIGPRREHLDSSSDHLSSLKTRINVSEQLFGDAPKGIPPCKVVGVQTDKHATDLMIKKNLSINHHYSRNLVSIWDPPNGQLPGRNLVPELLVACETDFHVLFGCLSSNLCSEAKMDLPKYECSSDVALKHYIQPVKSTEAVKLSHFYSMLSKIGYDMGRLEALFEALVELCRLDNVTIVHKSLCVLRVVLNHMFSMGKKFDKRDNVIVEEPSSVNNASDTSEFKHSEIGSVFYENASETSKTPGQFPFVTRLSNAEKVWKKGISSDGSSFACAKWVSLFELMHEIVMRNNKENIRLEAVSVMNMILLRTNAYVEREKYGRVQVFQSVSQLLRKESGLGVQKQAVHLLYLLLNCPKLMAMFCSGCKEEGMTTEAAINDATIAATAFQGFCAILDGLADCLACNGKGAQLILELNLRRNAIILLAFLASSGKSGFEILLGHQLLKRTNILSLILQILASEIDREASESVQPSDVFRERTLLIREALILLNRLASNPQYSTSVLRILTNSREMACLTTDVANRLLRKSKWLWQSDTVTRQMRESEVADLARMFKKRVFTFLGDGLS